MRVLHVVRGLANSSGTTHIVVQLAEEQARLGHDVTVFHVRKGSQAPVEPDTDLVESICFNETVLSRHVGFSLEFARTLRRRIRQFDVVHIHAVWNFPTWYTMRTAWRSGVPYIVAPQGSLEPWAYSSGRWLRKLHAKIAEKPLLNRASRLQALTDAERAQFTAFGLTAPSVVIPNGVAMYWLEHPDARVINGLGFGNDIRVVLYLSRLHPKKGLDILLRAFADLSRRLDNVMLVVAGDDAGSGYGEAMRDLADSLGLGGRCVFIGEVRGERKRAVFRDAELYVLTSHSEGLPVAVLEAMACRLPVLISPGCNLREVEQWRAGLVVEPTVEAVAKGMHECLSDGTRLALWGRNAQALVRSRFTWPEIAGAMLAEYFAMSSDPAAVARESG